MNLNLKGVAVSLAAIILATAAHAESSSHGSENSAAEGSHGELAIQVAAAEEPHGKVSKASP